MNNSGKWALFLRNLFETKRLKVKWVLTLIPVMK